MTEKIMNPMKKYSKLNFIVVLLAVVSILVVLPSSEITAAETISVNAKSLDNTILVEFSNSPNNTSEIKTVKVWLGGDKTFKSFKTESGWGGGTYSDGKLLVFTAVDSLKSGESVKFGLITNVKVTGINWKVLDQNDNEIDKRKTTIQEIAHTTPSFIEEESEAVEQAKETGSALYGTKKFIPEKLRVGSDIRLAVNGFGADKELKLYLDTTILKSVNTDEQGNFLTTISIPDSYNVGTSEFIIKDEDGNLQTTNVNIGEANNRFLKSSKFEVSNIPVEVNYDETLIISGKAYPKTAVVLAFEDSNRVLEKIRVVTANSNGEWNFEKAISSDDSLGERTIIIRNDFKNTQNNVNFFLLNTTDSSDQ